MKLKLSEDFELILASIIVFLFGGIIIFLIGDLKKLKRENQKWKENFRSMRAEYETYQRETYPLILDSKEMRKFDEKIHGIK